MIPALNSLRCCSSLSELAEQRPSACGCSNIVMWGVLWLATAGSALAQSDEPIAEFEPAARRLAHLPLEPYAAALTVDGARFATGHNDGSIVIWRTADGLPQFRLSGHRDTISGLAFNAAGDRLASSSYDGTIRVWSTENGSSLAVLEPNGGRPTCVAISLDGRQLASGGYDGIVRLWRDVAMPTDMLVTTDNLGVVRAVAISPAGDRVVAGDSGGGVRLLNASDLSLVQRVEAHRGAVRCVDFTPDGEAVLSGGDDRDFSIRDTSALGPYVGTVSRSEAPHDDAVVAVAGAFAGVPLFTGDAAGKVCVWNAASHELTSTLDGHSDSILAIGLQSETGALITIGRDRAVNLWMAKLPPTPRLASLEDLPANIWSLAVSPDQSTLYAAGGKGYCAAWDLHTGKQVREFAGFAGTIDDIDLSTDGQLLAVCGWRDTNMVVFDAMTGEQRATRNAEAKLRCVRFSPDGQTLVAAREDGKLQVWSLQDAAASRVVNVSEQAIYDLAFSPDGAALVACGGDWRKPEPGFLKQLDGREYSLTSELQEHGHAVRSAAFNGIGTLVSSADESGLVIVWNAATRFPHLRLKNTSGARPQAWLPDGNQLAVGLHDGSIHVWDAASGELQFRFRSDDHVFSIAAAPDGGVLYSASGKRRIEVWPLVESSGTIDEIRAWVR